MRERSGARARGRVSRVVVVARRRRADGVDRGGVGMASRRALVATLARVARASSSAARATSVLERVDERASSAARASSSRLARVALGAVLACASVGTGASALADAGEAPKSNKSTAQWRIYTDLGRGLAREGRLDEARRYLERALAEARKGFGEGDAHVAAALNNLAELDRIECKWEASEKLFAEALDILRAAYGENHPSVGTALHNLAGCRLAQNDIDGAYELYAKSLARKEATLGTNHPEYATTLYHMAEVLNRNNRREDAVVLLERSIKVSEEIGAAHTGACLRRMKRLAQLLHECERFEEAERVRRRVLHTLEHMNGDDHVKIAGACESLAVVLMKRDQLDEAASLLERSAKILSRVRGDGGALALASTRLHLAEVAARTGNHAKALKLCRLALDVLSPSALDALRRETLRSEIRVGVVVQHARAAALLRSLAPSDAEASRHVGTAAQNLSAVKEIARSDERIARSVREAELTLSGA